MQYMHFRVITTNTVITIASETFEKIHSIHFTVISNITVFKIRLKFSQN